MNSKRSRLQRKAARLAQNDEERAIDEKIGATRAIRDKALFEINVEYTKQSKELEEKRVAARASVWELYDKSRADLLREVPLPAAA